MNANPTGFVTDASALRAAQPITASVSRRTALKSAFAAAGAVALTGQAGEPGADGPAGRASRRRPSVTT